MGRPESLSSWKQGHGTLKIGSEDGLERWSKPFKGKAESTFLTFNNNFKILRNDKNKGKGISLVPKSFYITKKYEKLFPLLAIAVPLLAIFYPLVFLGKVPNYMDPMTQFVPIRVFIKNSISSGIFPLWNPYQAGGVTVIGNPQAALLYPINLILSSLGDLKGETLSSTPE
ncbi:hypothetical protein [Candidatus Hakubella thermalkaliphila]|uniref:hypothetical protein n=1 Tax=Candidatus Hakubella thermalkaliphila TaxID=2754717 RepID=UPI001593F414|nr:hypothetical protein [Candidatus Hakubella thermalkaliphila]